MINIYLFFILFSWIEHRMRTQPNHACFCKLMLKLINECFV